MVKFSQLLTLSVLILQPLLASGQDTLTARFTADVKLAGARLPELEIRLVCSKAEPSPQHVVLGVDGTHEFTVELTGHEMATCVLSAVLPFGKTAKYLGDGGSTVNLDHEGCHFSGVSPGHSNFCQIQVERELASVTVYKNWIGETGDEPDVRIHLMCNRELEGEPLELDSDSPQSWELDVSDPAGVQCHVFEVELDSFRADQSDCLDLLVTPGAREECTLVNTKVVKRIEMLNRYGIGLMILLVLAVGLIAIKRMVR